MDYLFRGVLPPNLPPVPTVELRQSDGQKKEKMTAQEVQMQTLKPPRCLPHNYRPSLQAQYLHIAVLKMPVGQAQLQSTKPPKQIASLDLGKVYCKKHQSP